MKVMIEKGELVVRIPVNTASPSPSGSGKTLILATTGGNVQTDLTVKHPVTGQQVNVVVGLNAYIYAQPK